MKYFLLLALSIILTSCTKENSDLSITGNWGYLGTCFNTAYCVDFKSIDPNASTTHITFDDHGKFSGRVSNLIVEGTFETNEENTQKNQVQGKFVSSEIKLLNKPFQTEEDTYFMVNFEASTSYTVSFDENLGERLSLYFEDGSLVFGKKTN